MTLLPTTRSSPQAKQTVSEIGAGLVPPLPVVKIGPTMFPKWRCARPRPGTPQTSTTAQSRPRHRAEDHLLPRAIFPTNARRPAAGKLQYRPRSRPPPPRLPHLFAANCVCLEPISPRIEVSISTVRSKKIISYGGGIVLFRRDLLDTAVRDLIPKRP